MVRKNPHLYEINLMAWLNQLSQREERKITLKDIPQREWKGLREKGMDLIWLMGVWQRSPYSRQAARDEPRLVETCRSILEDFEMEDIVGSPYAVYRYLPDPTFGSVHDLAVLKRKLEDEGLLLILDFVANHTACDYRWIGENPSHYIHTEPDSTGHCPDGFVAALDAPGGPCIAHGRDPYFLPWTDTAQVDYSNPETVRAVLDVVSDISQYCHGFRCDMAMLVVRGVLQKTWSGYLKTEASAEEFWPLAIKNSGRPPRLWLAEVYWGMEEQLLNLGFDYAYDKTFYDLLLAGDIEKFKAHLCAPVTYQEKLVRFLENHDEARAMEVLGPKKIYPAMVIQSTVPGMRFWHQGQLEGNRIQVPIQLRRAPVEMRQPEFADFCEKLLREVDHPVFHDGTWQMCETYGWPDNPSHHHLLTWCWLWDDDRRLIVVNFSPSPVQGYVRMPDNWLPAGKSLSYRDPVKNDNYLRSTEQVQASGLYVELEPWDFHFFSVERKA